jgi:hypothetical protein
MYQILDDVPANVVGVRAVGNITKEDFENVLLPAFEDLAKRTGQVNFLQLLDTDIKNFTLGAWIDDMKAGLKHFTKWNKVAIVSDQKGVNKFSDLFSYVAPGEFKGFPIAEYEEAKKWVSS